ncbi:glutathione S-transferase family protein [Lysobacter sp. KIS68-7]|uniref:glutathione S-transferase family protein n=1 Tax=Lysobacter sp. KIS68-7 TaxID=2904252 RepID=UPI001E3A01A0|nr:glutathione S-transferase family protein [Lysobacter sp. KIS68-7]UHQ19256.1 glutathione S-transferase family protein [Lysobacter sp. KIS68-7]
MTTTLYYAPGAASMVVHWLMIELGVPYELRLVDTAAGAQKSPEYLALNPNGVVPTLVLDDVPRFEAAALLMTLADRDPQHRFAPAHDDPQRADYHQWMFHLANAVQPLFRNWWYPHEAAGEANAELVRASVAPKIAQAWDRLDAHIAKNGPYMLGDRLSAADFYLAMLMRWSRNMPRPATQWPHLLAFADRMRARPSFARLYELEGLAEWGNAPATTTA